MKHYISLLLACVLSHASFSQDNIVQYFDKDWKETTDPVHAAYFRTVEQKEADFIVRDYFADTKNVQMVAECSAYTPNLVFHGDKTLYYKNGKIQSTSHWVDNKQRGKSSTFYDNGNPKAESEITEDGQRYSAFLSKEGHNLLGTGSAIIPVTDEPTPVASFQEVDDYKVIAQFYVDEAQDTIYGLSEKQAFYKTGMEGLMGDLRRNIKYPTSARRSGTEGTVYVIFKVTRHGRATDIKIVKGVSPECDEESLRVVNLLADNWSPAMHRGKPVATRFVLPVKYKLTGSPGRKK